MKRDHLIYIARNIGINDLIKTEVNIGLYNKNDNFSNLFLIHLYFFCQNDQKRLSIENGRVVKTLI